MAILDASSNGGRYNNVHNQTDDGIVFSVATQHGLLPITFRYDDYFGEPHETLISSGLYPHKRLMRGDCGWRRKDDSEDLLFSWSALEHVTDGFTSGDNNEYGEKYHEEPNCANDVLIKGLRSHRTTFYRKDREYWTPDVTLNAVAEEDFFGWEQYNPKSCAPKKPNKCGLVNFKEKC